MPLTSFILPGGPDVGNKVRLRLAVGRHSIRWNILGGLPLRFCFMQLRPIPPFLRDERWGCFPLASLNH